MSLVSYSPCVVGHDSNEHIHTGNWASLVAHTVKNLSAMWETWVPHQDQEDPMEKGIVTHSKILTWRIPWTGEPVGP